MLYLCIVIQIIKTMKKLFFITIGVALLVSSCGTYTGAGAYVGAGFGSIIGSAVGGISGGWCGSDVGTLVGMAGGAVVGAAIGAQADKAAEEEYQEHKQRTMERIEQKRQSDYSYSAPDYNDSGFDPSNGADDRFDFSPGSANSGSGYSVAQPAVPDNQLLEIRNLRFVNEQEQNLTVRPGEMCRVVFEVMNRSGRMLYNVQPQVIELTGNKHVIVSQGIIVERIAPGKGIRYTAMVKADDKLRGDKLRFRVTVTAAGNPDTAQNREFEVALR
jgi:hypothetical protein